MLLTVAFVCRVVCANQSTLPAVSSLLGRNFKIAQ
jgi:hypothetical protein